MIGYLEMHEQILPQILLGRTASNKFSSGVPNLFVWAEQPIFVTDRKRVCGEVQ